MRRSNIVFAGLMASAIAGCGGGSGSGAVAPSNPVAPLTPVPTVSLSIDLPKVGLGQSAKLTWSSTNATSCTASDAWAGSQATSGASTQTPTTSGALKYTLTCTGPGGTSSQSTALTVPMPVQKSSYENKIAASSVLGAQSLPSEVTSSNAVAFADFFQDGSYSMVTHTLEYIPAWSMSQFGHIRFYQRDNQGRWTDRTSALLKDTQGCLHPRKAVVADFNGDRKPDVFFSCHGYDRSPFPGEQPHLLLSQPDGTYQNKTLPVTCFCHSATAIDYRGDGFADIVVVDNIVHHTPFFLANNRDGSFSIDTTRLPSQLQYKSIFSIEAIDFEQRGAYDIWIGGNEPGATAGETTTDYDTVPRILRNDGHGNYPIQLAQDLTPIPDYGLPLDIVFSNGKIYLLRTNIGGGPINYGLSFYTTAAVQVIDYKTGASSLPYTHKGPYANGMQWVNWLIPTKGEVVSMEVGYGITLP